MNHLTCDIENGPDVEDCDFADVRISLSQFFETLIALGTIAFPGLFAHCDRVRARLCCTDNQVNHLLSRNVFGRAAHDVENGLRHLIFSPSLRQSLKNLRTNLRKYYRRCLKPAAAGKSATVTVKEVFEMLKVGGSEGGRDAAEI
jgi:hypothetical protein